MALNLSCFRVSRRWGASLGMCVVFFLGLVYASWADGKVFAYAVQSKVSTPDQRAMLSYANGVERLVIETSFMGEGTNFAWIVPLPSAPKIEPVSSSFFSSLSVAYEPKLVTSVILWWPFLLLLVAIVGLVTWSIRNRQVVGCVGMLVLAIFAGALLVPNFVRARGSVSSTPSPSVLVLSREIVGIYDTALLKSADGELVADWLKANGYRVPAQAMSILGRYAAEGWVFAAARIHRDHQGASPSRPHPLAFTFATERAVYPLRLTGVENEQCAIELYVFGSQRAEAPGFKVDYCGPAEFEEDAMGDISQHPRYFGLPGPAGRFVFADPELRRFCHPNPVTSKLVGHLSARAMERDAVLSWVPVEATFPVLHSRWAAFNESLNWAAGVGAVCGLWVFLSSLWSKPTRSGTRWVLLLALTLVTGSVRWATLSVTEVTRVRQGGYAAIHSWRQLDGALEQYDLERRQERRAPPATFEEFRARLGEYLAHGRTLNTFTGAQLESEPTAGNLTLRPLTNGVSVYWHDIHGLPHHVLDMTNSTP